MSIKYNWRSAWQISSFRIKLLTGLVVLVAILVYFPFFFEAIDNRNGRLLHDILLQWLTPKNMSLPVFLLIWASFLLLIWRLIPDPDLVLLVLWGYNLLTLLRMTCIGLISLNPPPGLIPLEDPLTNMFYGSHYITHDLFFSGHTATVCLIFCCLKPRADKYLAGFATILIGIFLLIQHVHYTIDVLAAPFFTYGAYRCALLFTRREHVLLTMT
ncbi:MAG: phosphatase PAP2-related protein [Bacteroidota bacterium]|nr:phosphatase PAP2-related protein [Bacteroidota bacterium]MDP4213223.1 phosphatase PAP2-related protein [Bacteroidota bacterium]MDP4250731.1 phosphatase PAP2-related protein [Bacteroidota bacterium]